MSYTMAIFSKDYLELVIKRKVLSQGKLMSNMKALTVTNQKIWPMYKFLQTNKQTNKQTHRQMDEPKSICPQYIDVGHKDILP